MKTEYTPRMVALRERHVREIQEAKLLDHVEAQLPVPPTDINTFKDARIRITYRGTDKDIADLKEVQRIYKAWKPLIRFYDFGKDTAHQRVAWIVMHTSVGSGYFDGFVTLKFRAELPGGEKVEVEIHLTPRKEWLPKVQRTVSQLSGVEVRRLESARLTRSILAEWSTSPGDVTTDHVWINSIEFSVFLREALAK